ncbi:MAG: bifunctional acetate--CoA ligase family protein/GNAT family N-acetyltransferase [Gaiellales bacterium]
MTSDQVTTPGGAAGQTRDVILRDGRTLRLRPPGPADATAVAEFFDSLSEHSRYLRLHGTSRDTEELMRTHVEADGVDRAALVATLTDGGRPAVVAVASYDRLRDPAEAEVAVAVADEHQGRGIGTRMIEQLAAIGRRSGIRTFVADVLSEDGPMVRVFNDMGFEVSRSTSPGQVEFRFPIGETDRYQEQADLRDHSAVVASLRPFFAPRSVAVIGASSRPEAIGGVVFRNILAAGFAGPVYPINPRAASIEGVTAYARVTDVPPPLDLAVVCTPADRVLQVCDEALAQGVPALCVISAGFAEVGREGARRQERLLELVRAHGARLVGPNCLGIASSGAHLNATFGPTSIPSGQIGFVSQSGALGLALTARAAQRGLGFSGFASIGNKADVSANDLLEYWEADPDTKLVLMYLESFGNPRKFGRLARRVARAKPVLAMKSGVSRAGARAAGSHTAALVGSDAAVDALFHQSGVIRAGTLGELIDTAVLLSSQPLPRGGRTAILTNAGGLGILCADACEAEGLELPRPSAETERALAGVLPREASLSNPIDMLGSATGGTYRAVLPHLIADPGYDAVIVLFAAPAMVAVGDVRRAVDEAAAGADKPVLRVLIGAEDAPGGHPASFAYPESAARALGRAASRSRWLRRPLGATPMLSGVDRERARGIVAEALRGSTEAWLGPHSTGELLGAYGVPYVPQRLAETPRQAVAAAAELGYPVVVKSATPGAHKTEQGGVVLDVATPAAVRAALRRVGAPALVQPMIRGGVELLAGVVRDTALGPVLAVGAGGVLSELIGRAACAPAPLTDVDAHELAESPAVRPLMEGFRGLPPVPMASLIDLILRLSMLADDLPEVAELDLNPVIGLPTGCVAVDARIRLAHPQREDSVKTW